MGNYEQQSHPPRYPQVRNRTLVPGQQRTQGTRHPGDGPAWVLALSSHLLQPCMAPGKATLQTPGRCQPLPWDTLSEHQLKRPLATPDPSWLESPIRDRALSGPRHSRELPVGELGHAGRPARGQDLYRHQPWSIRRPGWGSSPPLRMRKTKFREVSSWPGPHTARRQAGSHSVSLAEPLSASQDPRAGHSHRLIYGTRQQALMSREKR